MNNMHYSSSLLHQFGQACLEKRAAMVIVDIRQLKGSAPRGAGTLMFVSSDATAGTIGGGHLEFEAIAHARRLLLDQQSEVFKKTYALGPSLGQCCGGSVVLNYQYLTNELWFDIERRLAAMVKLRFTLHLFGAGHVGAALVNALAPLPCLVNWIDERQAQFTRPLPSNVREVAVDTPVAEVHSANPGDYYLVLTHSHALDLEIVQAVLKRGDAGYLGLIGSSTKRAVFTHRLQQKGLDVSQLHCPIGLPGITGKEPEVIAASIAADLLARSKGCV
jgi:xanthine dehydrogenase accessory factor